MLNKFSIPGSSISSVSCNKCSADAMSKCTDPLKVVTDNKDLGFATSKDELDEMCPWVLIEIPNMYTEHYLPTFPCVPLGLTDDEGCPEPINLIHFRWLGACACWHSHIGTMCLPQLSRHFLKNDQLLKTLVLIFCIISYLIYRKC